MTLRTKAPTLRGTMSPFEGFENKDFDAFEESKWVSNAFNLERLEVKLKLSSLGKIIEGQLGEKLSDLEMDLSEERPSIFNQHKVSHLTLFFYRDLKARKQVGSLLDKSRTIADNVMDAAPYHRHISLCVRVRKSGIEAGIFIHRNSWLDWKNAVERCKSYGESDRLAGILSGLGPGVKYSTGEGLSEDAESASEINTVSFIEGLEKADPYTIVGEIFSYQSSIVRQAEFVGRVADLFGSLLPLFRFISWTHENDFHGLKDAIKKQQDKAQRKFSSIEVGDKVRIVSGLASGRLGVVDAIEKKGVVKVRMGLLVMSLRIEDLAQP